MGKGSEDEDLQDVLRRDAALVFEFEKVVLRMSFDVLFGPPHRLRNSVPVVAIGRARDDFLQRTEKARVLFARPLAAIAQVPAGKVAARRQLTDCDPMREERRQRLLGEEWRRHAHFVASVVLASTS